MYSSSNTSTCGWNRATSTSTCDAGQQVGSVSIGENDGHKTHVELRWLNSGILIRKESYFQLWLLREKNASPGLENYLSPEGKKLPENEANREESSSETGGENALRPRRWGLKHAWHQFYTWTLQRWEPVGGGQEEDVTACWPSSWTRQLQAPQPFLCPWNASSVHSSHRGSYFKDITTRE